MSFEIRPLDLSESVLWTQLLDLHKAVFEDAPDTLERQLRHNTVSAPKGTIFYGAMDGRRLVGVVGFIRHSIVCGQEKQDAYQIVSVASDPRRRVFTSIMNYARSGLSGRGAFMFGFPNEKSRPIFVSRLGFKQIDLRKIITPNIFAGYFAEQTLRAAELRSRRVAQFDQAELIAWKSTADGRLLVSQTAAGFLWGKDHIKRLLGLTIRIRHVGGVGRTREPPAKPTISSKPHFLVAATAPDSPIVSAMGSRSYQGEAGAMILQPLAPFDRVPEFDIVGGLADFF